MRISTQKTFWKFLLKFDPIPFDKVQFCQKKMNEYSVRICENSIMKERNDMMLLATALETEWTKEFLIVLRENMISLLNEKKISPVELCVETLC